MGSKNSSVVIGYNYFMDILLALCHVGQNDTVEVKEIEIGGRTAWSGTANTSRTIGIYEPELFGGDKREGGVEGQVDIMLGRSNQPVNPYLGASVRASNMPGAIPAYRGILSIFFRGNFITDSEFPTVSEWSFEGTPPPPPVPPNFFGITDRPPSPAFMWSGMNPYLKPPRFKVARYFNDWQPGLSRIGNQMNAVHIIYEALTNPDWGMGYPTAIIDTDSFLVAAQILYDEGFGISLSWSQTTTIEDFISFILLHVSGVLNQNRVSGQIQIKMLRAGNEVGDFIELNPTNSTLESFSRPGLGESVNEVVVNFTNLYGAQDSVSVQDLAGVTSQGQVISQAVDLPGIRTAELAAKVAQRELEARIKPVSKISITTNRIAFALHEGDVFRLSWPDLGIVEVYYRVLEIDLGKLDDNAINITAVEDIFSFSNATYVTPQPMGWVDTNQSPLPPINYRSFELSYYDIITTFTESERALFTNDIGFAGLMAVRPQSDSINYRFYRSPNNVSYFEVDRANWSPSATLTDAIGYTDTTINYSNSVGIFEASLGGIAYLGSELVYIESASNSTATIRRGIIDTVPTSHPIGTRLWFMGDAFFGVDREPLVNGETVYHKYSTLSSRGQLPMSSSPSDSVVMNSRYFRPYPPGRLRINTLAYPETISGLLSLSWSHRNRLQQADQIVYTTALGVGNEPAVEYTVRVFNENNVLNYSGQTAGTSFVFENELDFSPSSPASDRVLVAEKLSLVGGDIGTNLHAIGVSSPIPLEIYRGYPQQVSGGWMSFGADGRFVDGTTGALTVRSVSPVFDSVGSPGRKIVFNYSDTAYKSTGSLDNPPYGTWTVISGGLDYGHNLTYPNRPIPDRRRNATAMILMGRSSSNLTWYYANSTQSRIIRHWDFVMYRLPVSAVVSGPLNPSAFTRTDIVSFYDANMAQFDDPLGWVNPVGLAIPPRVGSFDISGSQVAVIFGSLLYVPCWQVGSTANTAGRAVNALNILDAHLDIATSLTEVTRVYSITLDGTITPLAVRTGFVMADEVSATTGVEITNGTIRTVNVTTGALGSPIATLPSSTSALRVIGDRSTETFYVFAENGYFYRYDLTGTLLVSLFTGPTGLDVGSRISLGINLNHVYCMFGFYDVFSDANAHTNLLQIKKDLSGYKRMSMIDLQGITPPEPSPTSGVTTYPTRGRPERVEADPSSNEVFINRLFSESGASSVITQFPTPRLNDELTIELSSIRDDLSSYQTHEVTVSRIGWDLRWDESWGG
jgi:hypothetical protein